VDFEHSPNTAELRRLLVAADASSDPHRLVRLCCEHSGRDPLSLSLVVVDGSGSRPRSERTGVAESSLRRTAALLDAAGFRLEDLILSDEDGEAVSELVRSGGFDALLVCAGKKSSSPVLALAGREAGQHGLTVVGSDCCPPDTGLSWLRRAVNPLLHWARL